VVWLSLPTPPPGGAGLHQRSLLLTLLSISGNGGMGRHGIGRHGGEARYLLLFRGNEINTSENTFWGWDVYAWVTDPSLLFLQGPVHRERLMDLG